MCHAVENRCKAEQKGGKTSVDHLWLSKVFVSPEKVFVYKKPSTSKLTEDCIFALDTNALLAPYSTSPESVEDIEPIYKELARHDRLYVPAQAVREFAKNRTTKLGEVYALLQQRISGSVVTLPAVPMLAGIPEFEELRKIVDEVKPLLKRYHENLATLKRRLADWGWEDRVSQLYREVFTVDKIVEHEIDEAELKADLARRTAFKMPPGYKDASKDDEGIGDLLIWHTILALAVSKGKHIIFVSNEVKPDWMVRASGDALMPRPELTHEFHERTGKHFAVMNWANFLKAMNAKPETVREAVVAETSLEWIIGLTEVEMHIIQTTVLLREIVEKYLLEAISIESESSPTIPSYIQDKHFGTLVREYQRCVIAYESMSPDLDLINSHFHQMVPILGVSLGTNDDLKRFFAERPLQIDAGMILTDKLISHCKRFLYLHDQLIKYLEARLGREIVQRFLHPL